MNTPPNRGRAASVAPNRGRGRGRAKSGPNSPFIGHNNGQAGDADPSWQNPQWSQQGKRGNNNRNRPVQQRNNALNYSLDDLLPGSDEEVISQTTTRSKAQTLDERAARFSANANAKKIHYEELKKLRAHEREDAMRKGLIDDPDKPRKLQDAIKFTGTCQDMCPQFERLERELQHGLDQLEKDEQGNADPTKCVKTYRRSAAGNEQELPSDVRPPAVLERTLDHLFNNVLGENPIEKCHVFIRDRTRAVRKDFGVQNVKNMDAVRAHERIARFHILSLHEMCELDEEKFSEQQENEQLRKVLVSLAQFYDDLSKVGIYSENEAEFRAYQILTYIRDQDVVRWAQTLRLPIFTHPLVQRALDFHALAQRNNEIMGTSARRNKPTNCEAAQNFFTRFFKMVADKDTTFLMACMLEGHFPDIRKGAMKAMNKTYNIRYSGISAEIVRQMLGYDSVQDCVKEAELYGILVDYAGPVPTIHFSGTALNGTKKPLFIEPLSNPKPKKSHLLVEPKKIGLTFSDIICRNLSGSSSNIPRTSRAIPIVRPSSTTLFDDSKRISAPSLPAKPVKASIPFTSIPPATASPTNSTSASVQPKNNVPISASTFKGAIKPGFFALANVEALEQKYKPSQIKESETEKLIAKQKAEALAKKEAEEQLKRKEAAEKARIEEERRRQEAEKARQLAESERQRQMEAARIRAEEEATIAKKKADEEAHLKVLAKTRKMVIVSQLQNQICNDIIKQVIEQQVKKIAFARYFELTRVKRVVDVWRYRTNQKIAERKAEAERLERIRHTLSKMQVANPSTMANPYTLNGHVTNASTDAINESDMADDGPEDVDAYCKELIREVEQESQWRDQLWQQEDYVQYLYPALLPSTSSVSNHSPSAAQTWQLLICVEYWNSQPAQWIRHKFDLSEATGIKHIQQPELNIIYQSVASDADLDKKMFINTGAIIYQLSDERQSNSKDLKNAVYWTQEKERFHSFMRRIQQASPQLRVPIVLLYWPLQCGLEEELKENIPSMLNVFTTSVLSEHRVVVMSPKNVCEELPEVIKWVGQHGRKPNQLTKALKVEVVMEKFWEVMNWSMAYIYQRLSQPPPATVDDTVQNINHLVSIHNKAIDHLVTLFGNEDMHDDYMLPHMKPRPFAGRTITSADLYLLHTEWLSQIKFQIPKVEVPSSAQDMCHIFSTVSGSAFHVIQNEIIQHGTMTIIDTNKFKLALDSFQHDAFQIFQDGSNQVRKRKYPMDTGGLRVTKKMDITTSTMLL
ncbi:SAC3/GANP/Nin1/mts3/eIF-3 p25 family-domain-containing protein [Umbelopsis sp. AD052]|nr:SAC3/GANP/Nin1/mts3/eIF-3 p25 family-domain-containing protein [Umbelopsis sp. AD052]